MSIKRMMESLTYISENIDELDDGGNSSSSSNDLIDQVSKAYTPVLIMQNYQKDSDKMMESMQMSDVLTEANIISFDDRTKLDQLTAICALLISRDKGSEKFQMYKKASETKNALKIAIQEEEFGAARELAQSYLNKIANDDGSPVAKQAAGGILSQI